MAVESRDLEVDVDAGWGFGPQSEILDLSYTVLNGTLFLVAGLGYWLAAPARFVRRDYTIAHDRVAAEAENPAHRTLRWH